MAKRARKAFFKYASSLATLSGSNNPCPERVRTIALQGVDATEKDREVYMVLSRSQAIAAVKTLTDAIALGAEWWGEKEGEKWRPPYLAR